MSIVRKIPWTRKPPANTKIDLSHSLAKNCVFGYFPHNESATIYDIAGKHNAVVDGGVWSFIPGQLAGAAWNVGSYTSNNSWNIKSTPESRLEGLSAFTIMVYGIVQETGADEFGYFYSCRDAGGADVIFSQARSSNSNEVSLYVNGISAIGNIEFHDANQPHWYCVRWDGATARFYRGTESWGSAALSATVGTGIADPAIGNTADDGVDRALVNSDIAAALVFNKDIGEAALLSLINNPLQIFQPITQIIPSFVAAGGASLSVPVAMHQYARLRNN